MSSPADPQDALRCLHVSRDEACLTVSFSRPVLVSPAAFPRKHHGCGSGAVGLTGLSLSPGPGGAQDRDIAAHGGRVTLGCGMEDPRWQKLAWPRLGIPGFEEQSGGNWGRAGVG